MSLNTQEALVVVNKYKTGIESEIADKQRIVDAYQVLEDYLNGILDTPSQDMLDKQAELDTLKEAKDAEIATLIAEKEALIANETPAK